MNFQNLRIGQGYDIHRLVSGEKLILGGITIPSEVSAIGHSDADVLIHAISDALLGAAGLGDLGTHFPSSDKKLTGISSTIILKDVLNMLKRNNFEIINCDSTILLETPKLLPFIADIQKNISKMLNIEQNEVSIKAKTKEQLDSVGSKQGIEVFAIVLIYKNEAH
jgi:2-C-methyl-D-erythritol 2,4-cyclodiphosphate synthase